MNLTEYQRDAMAFRLPSSGSQYAFLNLAGEVGEVLSLEAKFIRDGGTAADYLNDMEKELGDVLWHLAAIADDHDLDLGRIAQLNISKLASRKARNKLQGSGDNR